MVVGLGRRIEVRADGALRFRGSMETQTSQGTATALLPATRPRLDRVCRARASRSIYLSALAPPSYQEGGLDLTAAVVNISGST